VELVNSAQEPEQVDRSAPRAAHLIEIVGIELLEKLT